MRRRSTASLLFLFAGVLLLAACGGDDDSADTQDSESSSSEQSDVDATAHETDDNGVQADEGTEGGGAGTGSGARDGPAVGDHWHAAYGIYVCESFVEPIADDSDPEGIHTHGDGIIHIHPFVESAAGANATMGKFFEAVGIELTDEGFFGAGGSLEEGVECLEGPGELKVARWSLSDLDAEPEIVEIDVAEVRFLDDLEVFTLAMVGPGVVVPPPPTIAGLGQISDVDPEDVPELPPGFAVAEVEPPGAGAEVTGETPCPAADGSSPRTTEFSSVPSMCIDPDVVYTAKFVTNYGDITVELDTAATPETVNNFVVLARYHYYDDTSIFRTAPSIAIIQGGSPHTNSGADPGPGYTIEDEADGFSYQVGDLAMARTPAPDSASAQYFFSAGPETALLDGEPGNPDGSGRGTYVTFGRTIEGLDVLEEILALHVPDERLAGGGPGEPVIVEQVLITEG
ncbi:MAG: peptidylprolyl isomerase [Acidimicrobiales bacterium]